MTTILTNILAAFGLFCLVLTAGVCGLFIVSWLRFERQDKRIRACQAQPRCSAEREAEQIILHLL